MNTTKKETEAVFEVLQGLNHTNFVYVLADLSAIRGWHTTIKIGDDDSPGDLLVHRVLPDARSVSLIYKDGQLTEEELQGYLDGLTADWLTVVVSEAPSEEALSTASDANAGIIGVGDVAKEVFSISAIDVVDAHVPDDSAVREEYPELFSTVSSQQSNQEPPQADSQDIATQGSGMSSDDVPAHTTSSNSPRLSENAIGSEGRYFNIELLGYEYAQTDTESGMLVGVQISANEFDIQMDSEKFTLHSQDGFTYDGVSTGNSSLMSNLAEELPAPWTFNKPEISAGGQVNHLVFFPVEEAVTPRKIRYNSTYKDLFTLPSSQIREQTDGKYSTRSSLEIQIPRNEGDSPEGLPDETASALASKLETLEDTASEVNGAVLSGDALGVEDERFAVEIEHWGFYHSAGEYLGDDLQDGIFISLDVTPKQTGVTFYNSNISILNTEGYVHHGRSSNAAEKIAYENLLNSPWEMTGYGTVSLPDSGKVKILVHMPCIEVITAAELILEGGEKEVAVKVAGHAWRNLRGLPEHLDEAIRYVGYESDD